MKKKLLGVISTAILLANPIFANAIPITSYAVPALNGADIINFDSYTTNEYLNDFSVGTVNFVNERAPNSNYFASDAFLPGESGRHIGLYDEGYITFDGGVDAVAFTLGAINTDWVIQAFSSTGSLMETIDIINPRCCTTQVYGFVADNIGAIRLNSTIPIQFGDVVVMDTLAYVNSVPEPSTFALFLLGLAGISLASRKHAS